MKWKNTCDQILFRMYDRTGVLTYTAIDGGCLVSPKYIKIIIHVVVFSGEQMTHFSNQQNVLLVYNARLS